MRSSKQEVVMEIREDEQIKRLGFKSADAVRDRSKPRPELVAEAKAHMAALNEREG